MSRPRRRRCDLHHFRRVFPHCSRNARAANFASPGVFLRPAPGKAKRVPRISPMSRAACAADDGPSPSHLELRMKAPLLTALAAGLALSGCTHLPVYEEWEARPSHPALPVAFVVVDSDGIERNCGSPPRLYVYG